ncbi:MAG: methylmalonyl Co-A mutase-associated GTPase MeaB [Proteobacteria bacterium]|nr:methylmalonyl Co-A mutase-associated GTPase MeaB [Pseudomonadota bacterium]
MKPTHSNTNIPRQKWHHLPAHTCAEAVQAGDRRALAFAITLVESHHPDHRKKALDMLAAIDRTCWQTDKALKLAISGMPGAGKSTLIAALGMEWIRQGHHVAVCAVDPSSTVAGGSILGDKTRMQSLSAHKRAFVRPSPSKLMLGGVSARMREVITLMMAAGFDRIILETVGVGQSEVDCAAMVDLLCVLQLAKTGDDLQSIKKGLTEHADVICLHKADNPHASEIKVALQMWKQAFASSSPTITSISTTKKQVDVIEVSSHTEHNLAALGELLTRRFHHHIKSGELIRRRKQQEYRWFADECYTLLCEKISSSKTFQDLSGKKSFQAASNNHLPPLYAAKVCEDMFKNMGLNP